MKKMLFCTMCIVRGCCLSLSAQEMQHHHRKGFRHQGERVERRADADCHKDMRAKQVDDKEMAKRHADRMREQLSLSDEQYAAVLDLFEREGKARHAEGEMHQRPTEEQRAAHRRMMDEELKKILTDEQMQKLQQQREQPKR